MMKIRYAGTSQKTKKKKNVQIELYKTYIFFFTLLCSDTFSYTACKIQNTRKITS